MRMFPLALAAGLAFLVVGSGGAMAACKTGPDTLFEDRFDTLDDPWGSSVDYGVEDGQFVIKPPAGYNTATINSAALYDDVDVCVDMVVQAPAQQNDCGAIIFWAIDYDNYYSFQISSDGQASFWRRQRGKWLNQTSWRATAGIEKGATVINELRVITDGAKAKLFINGTLFREVKGQPPKNGSEIGLLACSPDNASAHVAFDNMVVNTPSPDTAPASDSSASAGADNGGAGTGNGGDSDAKNKPEPAPSGPAPSETGPSIGGPKEEATPKN